MKVIAAFGLYCTFSLAAFAQQDQGANAQNQPRQEPLPTLDRNKESSSLPDAPTPQDDRERTPCPAGTGSPCAFLDGRPYFRDLGHETEHDRTTWQAFKNPLILAASSAVIAATVLDAEGTVACIKVGTCREMNPLYGSHPGRVRIYSIAMPLNAVLIYSMAKMKRNGDGNRAFAIGAIASAVHSYFGLDGLTVSHVKPPKNP